MGLRMANSRPAGRWFRCHSRASVSCVFLAKLDVRVADDFVKALRCLRVAVKLAAGRDTAQRSHLVHSRLLVLHPQEPPKQRILAAQREPLAEVLDWHQAACSSLTCWM